MTRADARDERCGATSLLPSNEVIVRRATVWRSPLPGGCACWRLPAVRRRMSSRYIGLTAAGCAVVGAVATARRWRTLALIPQIFRSSENGGTVPPTEPGNVRTLFVVALLWGIDKLVARALRAVRLAALPSSIVSLLLSYAGLSLVEVAGGKQAAERVMRFFQPGVDFLGRWMMAVYTVSIVPVPSNLGGFRGLGDFVTFSALHAASWLFSIASTALLVRSLTSGRTSSGGPGGEVRGGGGAPRPAAPKPQVQAHRAAVRSVWTTLTAASYALVPWLGEAPVRRLATYTASGCTHLASLQPPRRMC